MYGLDLFSGIGGITKALEGYVQPVAYCENDRYAQAVLLSRMSTGELPTAPIWDDIRSLTGYVLPDIQIIYGGFPCQDISVAGRGAGLAGKRSGLFFEIVRLVGEIRPAFVFLENVPAITSRGGWEVVGAFAALGYNCRWDMLSAYDVGAPHLRERFFLLAHTNHDDQRYVTRDVSSETRTEQKKARINMDKSYWADPRYSGQDVAHAGQGDGNQGRDGELDGKATQRSLSTNEPERRGQNVAHPFNNGSHREKRDEAEQSSHKPQDGLSVGISQWAVEPDVGRVAHGIPSRVDRLRGLGNAVVPAQAREAFERLMGFK